MARGRIGEKYCLGANEEKTNNFIVNKICDFLDEKVPRSKSYKNLITYVQDRIGHDKRYAIDSAKIESELNWKPKYSFNEALEITVSWYIKNFFK